MLFKSNIICTVAILGNLCQMTYGSPLYYQQRRDDTQEVAKRDADPVPGIGSAFKGVNWKHAGIAGAVGLGVGVIGDKLLGKKKGAESSAAPVPAQTNQPAAAAPSTIVDYVTATIPGAAATAQPVEQVTSQQQAQATNAPVQNNVVRSLLTTIVSSSLAIHGPQITSALTVTSE